MKVGNKGRRARSMIWASAALAVSASCAIPHGALANPPTKQRLVTKVEAITSQPTSMELVRGIDAALDGFAVPDSSPHAAAQTLLAELIGVERGDQSAGQAVDATLSTLGRLGTRQGVTEQVAQMLEDALNELGDPASHCSLTELAEWVPSEVGDSCRVTMTLVDTGARDILRIVGGIDLESNVDGLRQLADGMVTGYVIPAADCVISEEEEIDALLLVASEGRQACAKRERCKKRTVTIAEDGYRFLWRANLYKMWCYIKGKKITRQEASTDHQTGYCVSANPADKPNKRTETSAPKTYYHTTMTAKYTVNLSCNPWITATRDLVGGIDGGNSGECTYWNAGDGTFDNEDNLCFYSGTEDEE